MNMLKKYHNGEIPKEVEGMISLSRQQVKDLTVMLQKQVPKGYRVKISRVYCKRKKPLVTDERKK